MTYKIDIKNSNYVIFQDASIQGAMETITANHRGCAIVVDRDWLVVGVVSDGDIRRALVRGATTITPVHKVLNSNFMSISYNDKEVLKNQEVFFQDHPTINVVPVLGKSNSLVDIIVRGGAYKE